MKRIIGTLVLSVSTCIVACAPDFRLDWPSGSYQLAHQSFVLTPPPQTDILLVIDNSASMAGKQAQLLRSIESFRLQAGDMFGEDYHIAVVTTGMPSEGCPSCGGAIGDSCVNETGEAGRFQDRLGRFDWVGTDPVFDFVPDPGCRVVNGGDADCLFDAGTGRSTALVGVQGCNYPRGLSAMRRALQSDLLFSYNASFLRPEAPLVVMVISDGEDCGEVGEVAEGIDGVDERICSYAAKGVGPDSGTTHPADPRALPYFLTPVEEYHDFLTGLKGRREGMVKFVAIVGLADAQDPSTTTIEYQGTDPSAAVRPVCRSPACAGEHCDAIPSTRYLRLAERFGLGRDGYVDTICREDFFGSIMHALAVSLEYPRMFRLYHPILDPALVAIFIDGEPLHPYTCEQAGPPLSCSGPEDGSCPQGACARSWIHQPPGDPPDPGAPGGTILLADHLDLFHPVLRSPVRIELFYVVH